MNILSVEAAQQLSFLPPFSIGIKSKRKELPLSETKSFMLREGPCLKGFHCLEKLTGGYKSCVPLRKRANKHGSISINLKYYLGSITVQS